MQFIQESFQLRWLMYRGMAPVICVRFLAATYFWWGFGFVAVVNCMSSELHRAKRAATITFAKSEESPKTTCNTRDENGSDTDGYHRYHIYFHISGRIRIRIRIISIMSDKIRLDVDIINIRFKYSDMDTASDVEYSVSDTERFKPL